MLSPLMVPYGEEKKNKKKNTHATIPFLLTDTNISEHPLCSAVLWTDMSWLTDMVGNKRRGLAIKT